MTVSIYLPTVLLDEVDAEARHQERTVSQLMQFAWRAARKQLRTMQAAR